MQGIPLRAAAPNANVAEYTVSELSGALKRTLEDGFGHVRLRGEISGFKAHSSGHCYFSLKDDKACIDAVCFRREAGRLRFRPEDGLEIVAEGKITTYASRSKYQIVVEHMEPAGAGALMALLEERKKKLQAEGLFDPGTKRPLPYLPDVIGIVTSPTGAVIRDILHRLGERFPRHVLVWPVVVQGEAAAAQVAAAIAGFNRLGEGGPVPRPDLLIVARGGGSIEDLWAFNEEIVVRAAAASRIPLISAVGHETDTTLIDHAADYRAPTPSAAAERAVPVRADLIQRLQQLGTSLFRGVERDLQRLAQGVAGLARGLPDPTSVLQQKAQRLDDLSDDVARTIQTLMERRGHEVTGLGHRLRPPAERLQGQGHQLEQASARLGFLFNGRLQEQSGRLARASERLCLDEVLRRLPRLERHAGTLSGRKRHAFQRRMDDLERRLATCTSRLQSVSYQSVLDRGFALVRDGDGQVVKRAAEARRQDLLEVEFADGRVRAVPAEKPARKPGKREPPARATQGSLL